MLRLEALRAFVEVADHGNIKDASERLYRTPAAVSMTLKQIEERLGASLFETDRKTTLTETGRFLYEQAVVLLRDHDRVMEQIEAQAKGRSGRLRIASVPSVATLLLPGFLQGFAATRPDLEIDLVDTDSRDVRLLVENGQVDLGISGLSADLPGLVSTPIFRDPLRLVCRADSALATHAETLDWGDLTGEAIIMNEASKVLPSPAFQALARDARFSVRNVASLVAMVQAGLGVTLMPALATASLPAALTTRPLRDPVCMRTVSLHWRQDRRLSPVSQRFVAEFTEAARKKARELGLDAA